MPVLTIYKVYGRHHLRGFAKSLFIMMWLTIGPSLCADEIFVPSGEELFYEIPQDWTEIEDLEQRKVPIQLALAALKSNYEKIETLRGDFALASDFRYDKSLLNSTDGFGTVFERDALWHQDFTIEIVSDQTCKKMFRNAKATDDYFVYEGKRIERTPKFLVDTVSIDTPDEYVYVKKGDLYQGVDNELPGHSNVPIDNVAWVEQPEFNDQFSYSENIAPYRYYDPKHWASLDTALNFMDGKNGAELQAKFNESARVFETTDGGGVKWFRYQHFLNDHSEINVLCNDSVDFLPVYYAMVRENGTTITLLQVKWNEINDVFFPHEIMKVINSNDGEPETRYRTSASDIRINEPVNQDQFAYGALGLRGESLIMNQIQKKVYKLKDGKAVFFADYQTKQKDSGKGPPFSPWRVVAVLCGIALVAAGLFLMNRSKKRRPSLSDQ